MSYPTLFRAFLSGSDEELVHYIFEALMSDDPDDLDDAIDRVNDEDGWPDDFRYGLEGLQSFREFYDDKRLESLTPQQRAQVEEYDEDWTTDLVHQLHTHVFESPEGDSPELTPS